MSPELIGIIGIVLLFVFLAFRMYIGVAMALIGFVGVSGIINANAGLNLMGLVPWSDGSSYTLSVIPLFILMGEFAYQSGISKDLFDTAYKWFGSLPGGLTMSSVAGCAGFSAICGDSLATAVTMGTIAIPEMKKKGYDLRLSTGALAAGGTLGILIPPSVGFIFYAIVTEESVGKLFIAGIVPGIVMSLMYMACIWII